MRFRCRAELQGLGHEAGFLIAWGVVEILHRRLDVRVAHPLLHPPNVGLGDHPGTERVAQIVESELPEAGALGALSNRSKNKLLVILHGVFRRAQTVYGLAANLMAAASRKVTPARSSSGPGGRPAARTSHTKPARELARRGRHDRLAHAPQPCEDGYAAWDILGTFRDRRFECRPRKRRIPAGSSRPRQDSNLRPSD